MANDKDKKDDKGGGTSKSGSSFGAGVFEAVIEQVINEYVRPAVKQIPPSFLTTLKGIGAEKFLPILGVALSSATKRLSWGKPFSDLISELTAELRRAIVEDVGGGTEKAEKKTAVVKDLAGKLLAAMLDPRLEKLRDKLVAGLNETFDGKDEKEKQQIFALLFGLEPDRLAVFLAMEKTERDKLLSLFIKRAESQQEKSLEEAIQELKEYLRKVYPLLEPVLALVKGMAKKVDQSLNPVADALDNLIQKRGKALTDTKVSFFSDNPKIVSTRPFYRFW